MQAEPQSPVGGTRAVTRRAQIRIGVAFVSACVGLAFPSAGRTADTPVERGAYLVNGIAGCGNCHSPKGEDGLPIGPELIGGPALHAPVFEAYPPNLTPAPETGLGRWTTDQIVTALREGRTPQGTILRPPMPVGFYRKMSDSDARAIAAYLKNRSRPSRTRFRRRITRSLLQSAMGHRSGRSPRFRPRTRSLTVPISARSAIACSATRHWGPMANRTLRTAWEPVGAMWKASSRPTSLRTRPPASAGGPTRKSKPRSPQAFAQTVRNWSAPMPWYYFKNMTDADVDAVIAWLRSLKPIVTVAR